MATEACTEPDWCTIVDRMAHGDESAVEDLYLGLNSFRGFFRHYLGREHDEDAYHELILDLLVQIHGGKLREPRRLDHYARSIARNKVARGLRQLFLERNAGPLPETIPEKQESRSSPERAAVQQEAAGMTRRVLKAMQPRDREVLTRFYLDEQSPATIQAALDLNRTQFRLIKCRAKARFKEMCLARFAAGTAYTRFTA